MFQKGLKGVVAVQTAISSVDGDIGELRYRGELVDTAIKGKSFEEVAYSLWYGESPNAHQLQQLHQRLLSYRKLPAHITQLSQLLPKEISIMDAMRTLISAYTHTKFQQLDPQQQVIALTAALPIMTAAFYRIQNGQQPVEPREDLGHTANYLWMINEQEPSHVQTKALETYLKLTMEHGMNASTFAARVTISTESDIVSAITSALGTMKGPLHGGAPSGVIDLLDHIKTKDRIALVIEEKLSAGEKIMGFGHRVYRTEDPRSVILRKKCLELQGEDPWLDLAVAAETYIVEKLNEHKPGRALHTNVEFYAAAIMRTIEMPTQLFTPTFSIARIVGWTAHTLEQQQNNVIFRPQSEYVRT